MNVNERKSLERMLKATSGIWRGGDGLKYQRRIRAEWERGRMIPLVGLVDLAKVLQILAHDTAQLPDA
jgi:hypothetical protein